MALREPLRFTAPARSDSQWFASASARCAWRWRGRVRNTPSVDNGQIADRLDAFAMLLELSEANPYTTRAYRRAARNSAFCAC